MPTVAITFGLIMTVMGVIGYWGTGMVSVTALIPAFLGVPMMILGFLARNEKLTKHAMHAAVLLALAGLFGSARGIPKLFAGVTSTAVIMQSLMAALCAVFTVLSVKSFIDTRKSRDAESAA